ncbi:MAG: amidase [Actinomycetota bacterium]|nr:amidase [Actinomycetota bacterium]
MRSSMLRFGSAAAAALLLLPIGGAHAGGSGVAPECSASIGGLPLETTTIPQLEDALRTGRITDRQLVSAYLKRIHAYDGQLDAIRALNPDALNEAAHNDALLRSGKASGPLFGIPVLVKDNIDTTDMPTTAGSIALKGSVPLDEATVAQKLKDAGAIILGKTNLSEFAGWVDLNAPAGYSSLGGQVVNAYNFALTPSGSSAGSGVAGSMAFAAATVGTETSGSILSPSDANSLVGIKPTTGLISRFGILPLSPSFDTPGPMARDVTDAATMLSAMVGADPKDDRTADSKGHIPAGSDYTKFLNQGGLKGVRIGYSDQDRQGLSSTQLPIFDKALADLKKAGATLVETDKLYYTSNDGLVEITAIPNEFKASLNQYLATETSPKLRVRTLSDIVAYNQQHPDKMKYGQSLLQASDATPGVMNPATDAHAQASIEAARAAIDGTLTTDSLDAIVAPGPVYANVSAAAGYPTVIVPGGYAPASHQPMGISFLGTAWSEPHLISYGYNFEQISHARIAPTEIDAQLDPKGCG